MSDQQRSDKDIDFGPPDEQLETIVSPEAARATQQAEREPESAQISDEAKNKQGDTILDEFPSIQKPINEGLQGFEDSQTLILPKIAGATVNQSNRSDSDDGDATQYNDKATPKDKSKQLKKNFTRTKTYGSSALKVKDDADSFESEDKQVIRKHTKDMQKTKKFKIGPDNQSKVQPNPSPDEEDDDDSEELDLEHDDALAQDEDFEFDEGEGDDTNILSDAVSMMKKGAKNFGLANLKSGIQTLSEKGIDNIMNAKHIFDTEKQKAQASKLETAEENKKAYLQKYGLEFEVPSEYIQKSIFYPKNSSYILQQINYVVPTKNSEFMVETHYLDKDKAPEKTSFTDLYAHMITGCALRLVKSNDELTVLQKKDTYIFDEKDCEGNTLRDVDISFSPDGNYLIISSTVRDHIYMYEIFDGNVENIINDIKNENYCAKIEIPREDLQGKKANMQIYYGDQGNYFIAIGHSRIVIFQIPAILQNKDDYRPEVFQLDTNIFEEVWDIYFESFEDLSFTCFLAAQFTGKKKIKVFDIMKVNDKDYKDYMDSDENVINFFDDRVDDFTLRFTNKNEKLVVVLANGQENFTISESEEVENMFVQKNMVQLGDKEIKFISSIYDYEKNENQGFFIVACKDYDEFLHVFKSNDHSYHYKIPRVIQPGSIEVFDIHCKIVDGQDIVTMISLKDDQFNIDQIDVLQINKRLENMTAVERGAEDVLTSTELSQREGLKTLMDASCSAFSVGWPYITFTGLKNYLLIFNVFEQDVLHRIQIAQDDETVQVIDTFITTTKDLYFILRNNDKYIIYTLDLDNLNTFEHKIDPKKPRLNNEDLYDFQKVIEYSADEVGNMPLDDLFVRGSSRKEVIQLNQKLIIFVLHRGCLYYWTEGFKRHDGKMLLKVVDDPTLSILSKELVVLDDQQFFFCQKSVNNMESISEVVKITVKYNDFDTTVIDRENCDLFDYIDFRLDGQNMMLMLVLKKLSSDDEGDPVYIKILKMDQGNKCIFDQDIHDEDLKGVLKSGFYTLVDGHIYFRNQVIKMRYELMAEYTVSNFDTSDVFNKYNEVLELSANDRVKTKSPLNSIQSHRFAYVILNSKDMVPKRVMLMPYLHERKIFLNRIKKNTEYFYTSILHTSQEKGEIQHDDKNLVMSGQESIKQSQTHYHNDFVAINVSESKYYFYTEKGILQFRVDFSDITKAKGNIVSVSPDGLNFVFQIPGEKIVDIFKLAYNKMLHIKTIHIDKSINQFVKDKNMENGEYKKLRSKKNLHWLYGSTGNIQYSFKINNYCDICIQIKLQQSMSKGSLSLSKAMTQRYKDFLDTIYYFQSGYKMPKKHECHLVDKDDIRVIKKMFKKTYNKLQEAELLLIDKDDKALRGENLIISEDYSIDKKMSFSMDGDRIFFWNDFEIHHYDLKKAFKPENKKTIALKIDVNNKNSKIKTVEPGDERDEIAIVIDQVDGSLVFSWSIENNLEYQVFEVQKQNEILWSHDGKFIIATQDITTIPVVGCRLKCFKPDNFENRNQIINNKELGFQNGYRFDSKNHNWMLMYEYLCISHSYMTFVIQEEIEKIGAAADVNDEKLLTTSFDSEAFNYLYNRNHIFMRGDLVKNKFNQFDAILKKLTEIDPFFIQILHYNTDVQKDETKAGGFNGAMSAVGEGLSFVKDLSEKMHHEDVVQEKNSALHYAQGIGNNRTVDIILSNMADIDENNSEHYCQVMPEMIDIKSFSKYIERLTVRTRQMLDKNILRIETPLNDSIIAIDSSPTLFVDDIFYKEKFKEDTNNAQFKAYPVEILALKIDWIVSTQQGKEFLQALNQSENLDFFDITTLQVIIEYLYSKSKIIMLYFFLPLYMIQFGFFFMTMVITELHVKERRGETYMSTEALNSLKIVVVIGNQILTIVMVLLMIKVWSIMGNKYLGRVYTWFDIVFYGLNTITNQFVISNDPENVRYQRILCAFALLAFLAKTFYYLKLVDQIAPIIDIIIRIIFDIKWFMFVFGISIVAFSISFFLLGNNQVDYDITNTPCPEGETCNTLEEKAIALGITYARIRPSIWFGWDLTNGGGGTDSFDVGEGSQSIYLYTIYIIFQFLMQIHLLNMLIAYMGETFSTNNEKGEQIKTKDHLSFVLDNWYLKEYSLTNFGKTNIKNIKYIIAALPVNDSNDDDDAIGFLQTQMDDIKLQIKKQSIEQTKRAITLEEQMRMVLYNQEKMMHKLCK